MTPPNVPNGGGGGANPLAHPHPIFLAFGIEHARLVKLRRDVGPIVEHMAGYVQAFSTDGKFDHEWELLSAWARARGLDGAGLSLKSERLKWRMRQFNLIMRYANIYHLFESNVTPTTGRHLDETAALLGSAALRAKGERTE